jgi:hypothetical protein
MTLSRKNSKKNSQRRRLSYKKGGCGCQSNILRGGTPFFQPTYNPLNTNPYITYDINSYSNDPSRLIESSRNLPPIIGGRGKKKNKSRVRVRFDRSYKQKRRKTKNQHKSKMNGGLASLTPQYTNPISTFGDSTGSISSAAILKSTGSLLSSSLPYNNPINTPYGTHNPELV